MPAPVPEGSGALLVGEATLVDTAARELVITSHGSAFIRREAAARTIWGRRMADRLGGFTGVIRPLAVRVRVSRGARR